MLRRIRDLEGWVVNASNQEKAGTIRDFYFDDQRWTIRYLVVETGSWLMGRRVLISPMAVHRNDWDNGEVHLRLDRDDVKGAPPVDWTHPVDRRYESAYAMYYGYSPYWAGPALWGAAAYPLAPALPRTHTVPDGDHRVPHPDEQHVRSVHEVSGYHIAATDGDIGHVEDFLCNEADWRIRYLLVDTSNWIGGRTVLVDPAWVTRVEWAERLVHVDVTREAVKASPEYHAETDIDDAYEARLRAAYHRSVDPTSHNVR
jgi:hypothetical protein